MSPASRRATYKAVHEAHPEVKQSPLCAILGFCRTSMRTELKGRKRDERMKSVMPLLAWESPWVGYRRLKRLVCARYEKIGENAVRRLMKLMNLHPKPRKRKRKHANPLAVIPGLRSEGLNHIWCMDFLKDGTSDTQSLRIVSMEDEYSRECLSLDSRRKYKAVNVLEELERLVGERGCPVFLRSDNGPEFIAKEVQKWADGKGIRLVRSEPGSPWQNPFNESLNSTIRREFLERELFGSLMESKVLCAVYKWWYNNRREHSRIGNMTPKRYAEMVRWTERARPSQAIGLQQA